MKVLIICHKKLMPPRELTARENIDHSIWRTEYYVQRALLKLRHQVRICGLDVKLKPLRDDLKEFGPDIVFNLLEEFDYEGLLENLTIDFLQEVGCSYTGCSPMGLILAKNKVAAKKILQSKGIPIPGNRSFPQIVKYVHEDSSRGIGADSVVYNKDLRTIKTLSLKGSQSHRVFFESFIKGRELHVGLLPKSDRAKILVSPVWETQFGSHSSILTERLKWDFKYREKMGVNLTRARLTFSQEKKIQDLALKTYRVLDLNGCARIDLRMDNKDNVYVLEANPNPDLAFGDEFAVSMKSAGIDYESMISMILEHGLGRKPFYRAKRIEV